MSQHENQNKNHKKWRYVYRKIGITQRFNIEDNTDRERDRERERVVVVEVRLEW